MSLFSSFQTKVKQTNTLQEIFFPGTVQPFSNDQFLLLGLLRLLLEGCVDAENTSIVIRESLGLL